MSWLRKYHTYYLLHLKKTQICRRFSEEEDSLRCAILSGTKTENFDQGHWLNKPHAKHRSGCPWIFSFPVSGISGVLFNLLLWKPLKDLILPVHKAEELAALDQSELRDLLEIWNLPFWTQTTPIPWGFVEVGHKSILQAHTTLKHFNSHDWHQAVQQMTPGHGALPTPGQAKLEYQHPCSPAVFFLLLGMCGSYFISLRE